jgi:predicted metal-dependent phosphoesterase TrpH
MRSNNETVSSECFCDLHTHSCFSDGTATPEEITDLAIEARLSAVALTDHNTTTGLTRFLDYARGKDIIAVPGVEVSCDTEYGEVHILGLGLRRENFPLLEGYLDVILKNKRESNSALIRALQKDGYKIDEDELLRAAGSGTFNRAHVAESLMRAGYVASISEAFDTLLKKGGKYYREPKRIPALECISYLSSLGARVILAHPLLNLTEDELSDFLPRAKAAGLDGIEVLYTKYGEREVALSYEMADKYGLLYSGGSDYHGKRKPDTLLGRGLGNLYIPMNFYKELKI